MTQPTQLLTASQVVERLAESGVTVVEETVRSWARQKQIRYVRLPGGRYRFYSEDVEAILRGAPVDEAAAS